MNSSDSSVQPKPDDDPEVVFEFTPEQVEALAQLRASFTPDEIAEIKRRQRESDKLIAKLAATETLDEQQRLADELCPQFHDWIRGRNRIQSARARRQQIVAKGAAHPRAVATLASGATKACRRGTSGQDPGGDDYPDPPGRLPRSRPRRRADAGHPDTALALLPLRT